MLLTYSTGTSDLLFGDIEYLCAENPGLTTLHQSESQPLDDHTAVWLFYPSQGPIRPEQCPHCRHWHWYCVNLPIANILAALTNL